MAQSLSLSDSRLSWAGANSIEQSDEWAMPWRINHNQRTLFHPSLVERAAMPAGVRLTFQSETTSIAGVVDVNSDVPQIDVVCDGELVETLELSGCDEFQMDHFQTSNFRCDKLPAGNKTVELWLPHFGQVRLRQLEIDEGTSLTAYTDSRPRWITYGSSITQCRTASSPTETWPGVVARNHNLNLTCLGFGGQCHLDSMIARQIRDTPADLLSLCLGINIYGNGSLNERSFCSSILGFVQILREKHPTTPIVLMSPIFSVQRETTVNPAGFTLVQMRQEVKNAVETLRAFGDEQIYYINGLDILGADLAHLLPDDLHPNAEGYRLMGERIGNEFAKLGLLG